MHVLLKRDLAETPKLHFQNNHLGMVWPGFPSSLISGFSSPLAFRGLIYRHEISSDLSVSWYNRYLKPIKHNHSRLEVSRVFDLM